MYPFEREDQIMALLRSTGQINIARDSERLGTSRSTLHRDLEKLERQGLVKKVRGGAMLRDEAVFETHFDIRMKTRSVQKQEIARKAAPTVQDDTAIFLDHSSTTLYLVRELKQRQFRNLTVLTNSIVISSEMGGVRGVQVLMTGGLVESEFKCLSGRWVLEFLKQFNLHQIFASVGGVSVDQGLTTQVRFIVELLPEIFNMGGQVNILVDSSKFHKIGTFQISPLNPGLRLFTDDRLSRDIQGKIQSCGVTLII